MTTKIIDRCRTCGVRRIMWGSHDGSLYCKKCFENRGKMELSK
ncbi:MAG: hypothetical protein ACPF9I_07050 [Candidatus Thalassarchaeaceae archaeon]